MSLDGQKNAFTHQITTYLENLKGRPKLSLKVEPGAACFNCTKNTELQRCQLCREVVCDLCSMKALSRQRSLLFNSNDGACVCFGCRTIILNNIDLMEQDAKSKKNFNFDPDSNTIHEPNWLAPTKSSKCFWCAKDNAGDDLVLCSLCGDCFCVKCSVDNDVSRPVFPCPFNKMGIEYLCHPCYFVFHSGVNVNYHVDMKKLTEIIYDIFKNETPKDVNPSCLKGMCSNCTKKTSKMMFCVLCVKEMCKLCVQFFILPHKFDAFKVKKRNKHPVCFDCRNNLLKQHGCLKIVKQIHERSNIDIDNREFYPPVWKKAEKKDPCNFCGIKITRKAYVCNLCGDILCKNCRIQVEDPSAVFFNPFYIYSFSMCFECQFYKVRGFIMISEKALNKSDTLSLQNKDQTMFEEVFSIKDETVMDCFQAFQTKPLLLLGKMFITQKHICFFPANSNVKKSVVIDISQIQSFKMVGLIKNQFVVRVSNNEQGVSDKYSFSFASVFKAPKHLKFIESLLKNCEVEFTNNVLFSQQRSGVIDNTKSILSEKTKVSSPKSYEDTDGNFDFIKDLPLENIFSFEFGKNADKIFEFAFSDSAAYSLKDYYVETGQTSVECTKWAESTKTPKTKERTLNSMFAVKGLPNFMKAAEFAQQTRVEYLIKGPAGFSICTVYTVQGVPYCEHVEFFNLLKCTTLETNKCKVSLEYATKFNKPINVPFLQKKISSRSLDESKIMMDEFLTRVNEKINGDQSPPNVLNGAREKRTPSRNPADGGTVRLDALAKKITRLELLAVALVLAVLMLIIDKLGN